MILRILIILAGLLLAAGMASAGEPDRTERTAIVGGIAAPAGATTTTNFGGQPLDERNQGTGAGEGASAAAASGSAAGATGGHGTGR